MSSEARKRLVRDEAGFTLTEMLVTTMIMIIVLFALFGIFDMGLRVFSFGNDKIEATAQARLGMEKMTREIRAAYPVDKIGGKQHVFFTAGASATATRPLENSITFGNDLPVGATPPNRMVDTTEEITYELRLSNPDGGLGGPGSCPTSGTDGVCTIVRRKGSTAQFQPVVESVVPNDLTFEYLTNSMGATDSAGNGTDIGVVRITLRVSVDRGIEEQPVRQTLTTNVDLKNK